MTPEFSRKLVVDRIPPEGQEEAIAATPEECEALARRFDLPAVHALEARIAARPWQRGGIALELEVEADIEQVCVVSLEPFPVHVAERGTRYYLAANAPGARPPVVLLESLEDEEPETIDGGAIDIGEVASEMLGLALDPYPRKPDAVFQTEGEESGGVSGAFAPLRGLRKP
jgi:hypothetical protein